MDVKEIRQKIIGEVEKEKAFNPLYKIDGQQFIGTRERQEDTIICLPTEHDVFACLADGIGGLFRGDIASSIACYSLLRQRFINSFEENFLIDGFQSADRQVVHFAEEHSENGSGCTLIGIWIENDLLRFCSIGDSLLYLLRNNEFQQLNRRHNYKLYLDELLVNKEISNHDYQMNLNKKDVVISYIGKGDISLLDYNKEPIKLMKDDIIVICSDGVFNGIDERTLEEIIKKSQNPATINTSIMNILKMKKISHQDNASIITIKKL